MNSDHDPGPLAGIDNSSLPKHPSRHGSRTESISVSAELAISTNSRSRPKQRGHSRSTSPKMDSPPCFVCGMKFRSLKALYGHYRWHPERPWRGINPPPNMAEENQTVAPSLISNVLDSVNESGGENEKDKKAAEVVMAEEKGEACDPCASLVSSCVSEVPCVFQRSLREDAPPNHGLGNSATVGETDRLKKGRLCIDLNKLPDEEDDPDPPDSGWIHIFGIRYSTRRKFDH